MPRNPQYNENVDNVLEEITKYCMFRDAFERNYGRDGDVPDNLQTSIATSDRDFYNYTTFSLQNILLQEGMSAEDFTESDEYKDWCKDSDTSPGMKRAMTDLLNNPILNEDLDYINDNPEDYAENMSWLEENESAIDQLSEQYNNSNLAARKEATAFAQEKNRTRREQAEREREETTPAPASLIDPDPAHAPAAPGAPRPRSETPVKPMKIENAPNAPASVTDQSQLSKFTQLSFKDLAKEHANVEFNKNQQQQRTPPVPPPSRDANVAQAVRS